MALTPEEKDRNKQTRQARDKAYRERCREHTKVEDAGLAEIATAFDEKINAALEAERVAEAARDDALKAIDQEIAALQQKREQVKEEQMQKIREAREPLRSLVDEKNAATADLRKRLDQDFPDLVGTARWSAAAWSARQKQQSSQLKTR